MFNTFLQACFTGALAFIMLSAVALVCALFAAAVVLALQSGTIGLTVIVITVFIYCGYAINKEN